MTGILKQILARWLGMVCIVVFAGLVLDVLWGVVTRYVFGNQAHWTEELARFLLVWLALVGAALAYLENSHLGVDILTRSLDPGAVRWARFITHLVVFLFAVGVMICGGVQLVLDRWQSGQLMSALPIRRAWFYLSLPVSGLLIALLALDSAVAAARGRLSTSSEHPVEPSRSSTSTSS